MSRRETPDEIEIAEWMLSELKRRGALSHDDGIAGIESQLDGRLLERSHQELWRYLVPFCWLFDADSRRNLYGTWGAGCGGVRQRVPERNPVLARASLF
jgi:hypothetical protein